MKMIFDIGTTFRFKDLPVDFEWLPICGLIWSLFARMSNVLVSLRMKIRFGQFMSNDSNRRGTGFSIKELTKK